MLRGDKPRWKKNKTDNINNSSVVLKTLSRIIFYVLSIAFFAVVFYVLLFSGFLKIDNVNVSGTSEINPSDVSEAFLQSYQGVFLKYIPRNNYMFIFHGSTENILKQKYKKIEDVKIIKKFPNTIYIEIKERQALLIWCSNEKCFFVDKSGFIYEQADLNSDQVVQNHLVKIVSDDGANFELGQKVLDEERADFCMQLKDSFSRIANVDLVEEMHINSRLAEDFILQTKQGWKIMINAEIPPDESAKALKIFFAKSFQLPTDQLEYVDLRVENKIFYKLKNQETSQEGNNSEDQKPKEEKK